MNVGVAIDCTCGYAFYASRAWCEAHKSAVLNCPGFVRKDGVMHPCPERYTSIGLLKAMTRYTQCTHDQYSDLHTQTEEADEAQQIPN